ncbi:MAG: hypothetical protein ACREAG_08505 [Nitrosopumilaceae archaeon]
MKTVNDSENIFDLMKELIDKILELDDDLRFVGVVNTVENTLCSKMKEGKVSLVTPEEEERFAVTLQKIKNMQDELNDKLGGVTFTHVIREKIHQMVYYKERFIIYATCERRMNDQKLYDISKRMQDLIKETLALLPLKP